MKHMTDSQRRTCEIEVEKLRDHIRMRGFSLETERRYCMELRKFIAFRHLSNHST